ncbi:TRAP transporter small permease [Fulvimarina sp. 2208YS6-2-32]|uniref:TRAP transporter small permease protein n=1 Tax=Fulvimarina uroteuthidis TaxID=3098149 RepID=A0ABU5I1S3_9HYPH|nr:TRAP transporter small permease [Fulvimarina sp. 2208YS6-2-32]MDY8108713.1 TRAP transporter small permease [Fulvimarina sp. 2208YS6-2-32]
MTKILNGVEHLAGWLTSVMFLAMTGLVCVQVFYRYVLNVPLTGSEEAARALMVLLVMIGSAIAVRNGTHMAISYFVDLSPRPVQILCSTVYFFCIFAVALLLSIKGFELADRTMFQRTPALQIPKGYLIAAFPISGMLMTIFGLEQLVRALRGGIAVSGREHPLD